MTQGDDGLDAPITIDLDLLTAGDDEDIEAYTGLDDVMARIYAAVREQGTAQDRFLAGESDQPPGLFIEYVRPSKLRAALLGVMKRHTDPSFGPERWREVPYASFLRSLPEPPAEPEAADPTQAAETVAPEPSPSDATLRPTPGTEPTSASIASPPTPPSP